MSVARLSDLALQRHYVTPSHSERSICATDSAARRVARPIQYTLPHCAAGGRASGSIVELLHGRLIYETYNANPTERGMLLTNVGIRFIVCNTLQDTLLEDVVP
jgi:hypothetical protein